MFYGTKLWYKGLYFLTAMSPAYILFILQIHDSFKNKKGNLEFFKWEINFNIYCMCAVVLFFFLILAFILKRSLIRQYKKGLSDRHLGTLNQFKENNLAEENGNITTFLLGAIIPAVLIVDGNLYAAIVIFILLQFIIYKLIMRSTDLFPNVLLVILGINLCKTIDNNYVFTFKSKDYESPKVYIIGDPSKSRMHITMYKK